MGVLEEKVSTRKRKRDIRTALLVGLLGGATLVGFAALGPALIAGLTVLNTPAGKRIFDSKLKRSLKSLINSGLVNFNQRNGKKYLDITERGRAYLSRKKLCDYPLIKPKRWDGKWRI